MKIHISLREQAFEAVRTKSIESNKTVGGVINQILEEYFNIEPWKRPRIKVRKTVREKIKYSDRLRTQIKFKTSTRILNKLYKIIYEEHTSKDELISELIAGYEIQKPRLKENIINHVHAARGKTIRQIDESVKFYIVDRAGPLSHYSDATNEYKKKYITWETYTQSYIERLKEPDAQEKIKEIIHRSRVDPVYITSFESDDVFSLRAICAKYINDLKYGKGNYENRTSS